MIKRDLQTCPKLAARAALPCPPAKVSPYKKRVGMVQVLVLRDLISCTLLVLSYIESNLRRIDSELRQDRVKYSVN